MIMNKKQFYPIIIGIIFGLFLKAFVIDIIHITGPSMEPTLKNHSYALLFKLAYGINIPFSNSLIIQWKKPQKNDIITYVYGGKTAVKRCVANAGDTLDFSVKNGYSLEANKDVFPITEEQFHRLKYSKTVPQDTILAIGDNVMQSVDSREYGFIPVHNILAKVVICNDTE